MNLKCDFTQEFLQKFLVDKYFLALYTIRILFQTAKAPRRYRCVVAAFYKKIELRVIKRAT